MHEKISLYFKRFVCCLCSVLVLVPFLSVPVLADTTYYSYDYFGLKSDGTVLGVNLNVSKVSPVVFSVNYGGNVSYYPGFVLYAGGFSSSSEAQSYANLYAKLTGVPKSSSSNSSVNWTYGSIFSGSIATGSFLNSQGQTTYFYISYICLLNGTSYFYNVPQTTANNNWGFGAYCYSDTDLFSYVSGSPVTVSNVVLAYAQYKLGGILSSSYTIATVPAKTWLKNSETIVPSIDVSQLSPGDGNTSNDGVNPGPNGDSGSGDESGSGGSSGGGDVSQTQTQSIAQGAVAFTVEDGAFSLTQSQSIASDAVNNSNSFTPTQTIEENAVNVVVNNNNEFSPENYNELNSLINNYNGVSGDDSDPFQQAIGNFKAFSGIASAFSALALIVMGWLPSWVSGLLGIMFSMIAVFTVLRLLHLFK